MKQLTIIISVLLLAGLTACGDCGTPDTGATAVGRDVFWTRKYATPTERFALARRTQPELIMFLRRMPKGADLHNHLSGATYSDYLLDSARDGGLNYDLASNKFVALGPVGKVVSIDDLIGNSTYLAQFLNTYSMRGWYNNTTNGHDHFFDTFKYMSSAGRSGADNLAEVIARNLYQNVQYMELMTSTAPWAINQAMDEALKDFDERTFTPAQFADAFAALKPILDSASMQAQIIEYNAAREQEAFSKLSEAQRLRVSGDNPDLSIRYVPQLYRTVPLKTFFRDAAAAMMSVRADKKVVALNMVQAEDDPRSRWNFTQQMKALDFLWPLMDEPRISLHAAELALAGSPVEAMRQRMRMSIDIGHAKRIGHGVAVAWSDNPVKLLDDMRARGILVEICLTSNMSILGVEKRKHPFALYRRAGVPLSLNTDDEGVSRSLLTMEYVKAVEDFDLSYPELLELARNGLEYAFLPGESLYLDHDYRKPRAEFAGVRDEDWEISPAAQALMNTNPKLARQVRFERALLAFEASLATGFLECERC